MTARDAIVIGSGPNGLAAAITLARAGRSVRVFEAAPTPGGGARSDALTRPGFLHDVCSAIHPLVAGSPFFLSLRLDRTELDLIHSPSPLAHPLDDGTAVLLERSIEETAIGLGPDADAYRRLMTPLVRDWAVLVQELLGPFRLPRHPVLATRFGWLALRSTTGFARGRFRGVRARVLLAGLAGHSMLPLEEVPPPVKTAGQAVADPGRAGYNLATATGVRVADPKREEGRLTPPSLSGRATSEKGCDCDHEALCRG